VSQPYNILVVGPSWVGDMVMAQSLFITLKQHHPHCNIDVLAPAWTLALLERMPEVRLGIAMPLGHGQFGLVARYQLGQQLRNHYQQAIVLPNSWKSALIPFFAGIPTRTGFLGELRWGLLNDARPLNKQLLTMTVQRFVALGLSATAEQPPVYPLPSLNIRTGQQQAVSEKFAVSPAANKIVGLCPGAEYGPAKRWPVEHFAELARKTQAQGWQVWLFGSDKDRVVAEEINQLSGNVCRNFAGQTSLGEAVDLLSLTDGVVSNDSGLMHVAAALNKKLVAIYGSSDPGFTPPLNADARIIDLKLDCSPCFKRVCPLGHNRCLTEISPDQVLAALEA
jgi:heptosyltransferase-2